jgi:hypothetical protein
MARRECHSSIELVRQGYVGFTEKGSHVRDTDDRPYLLPKDLRTQCVDFLHKYGSSEWTSYLEGTWAITCLNVLPQRDGDLVPYGRIAIVGSGEE